MQLDQQGNFVASPLLSRAPSLENGDLEAGPPARVAFRLNPAAVWDDGSPITSRDFEFTWRAIEHTAGSFWKDRYADVVSVDSSDPSTAVVTLREVRADWPQLFGGLQGFILKRAAFPNMANDPKPDLREMLLDAIPFSGGPWILASWSNVQTVLRRNERYFAEKAALDQVTFVSRTDQDTEIASLLSGEVAAIAPQPGEPDLLAAALSAPHVAVHVAGGRQFDALWFSQTRAPTNDRLVREAIAYAIDREPILDALARPLEPAAQPLGCGFVAVPGLGPWCATEPFATFRHDPDRARKLLGSAGYDCSSNPCTKQGQALTVEYVTMATNTLKTRVRDIVKQQLQAAGFVVQIKNIEASSLVGDFGCFARLTVLTQCNLIATPSASVSDLLPCDAIPSEANQFVGRNQIGWCDPEADHLLQESERELDPAVRAYLMHLVYERERAAVIGLPLFAVPAVVAWRTDKVQGPVGEWAGSPYGPFFNMDRWRMGDLDAEGVAEG